MNKTALITGASSGIGLELSKTFARNSYNLIIVSQNESNLKLAQEIIQRENKDIKILALAKDLSHLNAPQEIFDYVSQAAIQVDVLVNNAGVQVYGNFHDTDIEDTIHMLHINILALTKLTSLFIQDMIKNGNGRILNVGSTGSFQPVPLNAAYCASKAYVLNFSEGIAEELKGTGVTITTLCPGATRSNFAKRANIEDIKLFNQKLLQADKVAVDGYKALMKGKRIVVVGLLNKMLVTSVRFIPRRIITKLGMSLMKKL